jgi:hypothetical protein
LDLKIDSAVEKLDLKIDSAVEKLDLKIDLVAERLDLKIDALGKSLDNKIDALDAKFSLRFEEIDRRLDNIEEKMVTKDDLKSEFSKFETLLAKQDSQNKAWMLGMFLSMVAMVVTLILKLH